MKLFDEVTLTPDGIAEMHRDGLLLLDPIIVIEISKKKIGVAALSKSNNTGGHRSWRASQDTWEDFSLLPNQVQSVKEHSWEEVIALFSKDSKKINQEMLIAGIRNFIISNLKEGPFCIKDTMYLQVINSTSCLITHKRGNNWDSPVSWTYKSIARNLKFGSYDSSRASGISDFIVANIVRPSPEELLTSTHAAMRHSVVNPNRTLFDRGLDSHMKSLGEVKESLKNLIYSMKKVQKGPTKKVPGYQVDYPANAELLAEWSKKIGELELLQGRIEQNTEGYERTLRNTRGAS